VQPYLVIILNALIPTFVDFTLKWGQGYLTRSSRDQAKMKRIFFFVMLNTLILPLVAQTSALAFFKDITDHVTSDVNITSIAYLPNMISGNLMS